MNAVIMKRGQRVNYSLAEVARVLGVSLVRVDQWTRTRRLDSYRVGDQVRVTRTDLWCFCVAFGFSTRWWVR